MNTFIIVGLVCFVFSCAFAAKLPPTFKLCKVSDSNSGKCFDDAIESAVRELKKGYQPLGIYSIDPLMITALDIDQGQGAVSINLKFNNLLIEGVSDAKISNVKVDIKNYKIVARARIPKLILRGGYKVDGRVLILPIRGEGDCRLVLDDVVADIVLHGKESNKDGVKYMKIEVFDFKFDTKKMTMKFENLFNGDKALGDNMNRFLNENWQDILKELKPAIQETFGVAFADISNRIFTKVPVNSIFPQ